MSEPGQSQPRLLFSSGFVQRLELEDEEGIDSEDGSDMYIVGDPILELETVAAAAHLQIKSLARGRSESRDMPKMQS